MKNVKVTDLLGDLWSYVGTQRDNEQPLDANWIQQKLLAAKSMLEANDPYVWLIARNDKGDGFIRIDTSAIHVYGSRAVASEDLKRFLFPMGYSVFALPIMEKPQLLPKDEEQRKAWEAKEKK